VITIALTGGIGSGKSEVERLLAARGALVVDADALAREVVGPGTPGLAAVLAAFGPAVQAGDGSLDRAALAALVFADEPARRRLEAIMHPLVRERAHAVVQDAARAGRDAVVYSVPLLVEAGLKDDYDVVVVVDAPDQTRLDRLVRLRGMSRADALARMASQATRADRLAAADLVVVNDGTPAQLAERVDRVWDDLSARARAARPRS
jgi:dephospho-CoA kinase